MAIALGLIFFGAILMIAGWKDESVLALARGQVGVAKPPVKAGGS